MCCNHNPQYLDDLKQKYPDGIFMAWKVFLVQADDVFSPFNVLEYRRALDYWHGFLDVPMPIVPDKADYRHLFIWTKGKNKALTWDGNPWDGQTYHWCKPTGLHVYMEKETANNNLDNVSKGYVNLDLSLFDRLLVAEISCRLEHIRFIDKHEAVLTEVDIDDKTWDNIIHGTN